MAELRDKAGDTGKLIWDSSRFYVDFYTQNQNSEGVVNPVRQCAMHDASALVCVIAEGAFDFVSGPARVVEDGVAAGQIIIDRKSNDGSAYALPYWTNRPLVHVALNVDAERVLDTFMDTITQYASESTR